jgi:Mitosis protein DIM1
MFALCLQHIMIDLGTGNNNKVNWAMTDKQEFIDIVEVVYRGARKGRGLVVSVDAYHAACAFSTTSGGCSLMLIYCLQVSPKDYSTKYRY